MRKMIKEGLLLLGEGATGRRFTIGRFLAVKKAPGRTLTNFCSIFNQRSSVVAKQLLIYNSAVPVSAAHCHRCPSRPMKAMPSAGVNAVPLMAVEFPRVGRIRHCVHRRGGQRDARRRAGSAKRAEPVPGQTPAGRRTTFRRSFAATPSSLPPVPTAGPSRCASTSRIRGSTGKAKATPSSAPDAKPTPYVEKVLEFLKEFQAQFEHLQQFCRRIKELQLLEPMRANVTTPKGEQLCALRFPGR